MRIHNEQSPLSRSPPSSLSHQRDQSQRDQSQRDQSQRDQSSLGWLLIITLCCLCALSCRRDRAEQREDVLVVSVEQHSSWIRNFNPFSPNARRFTRAGVYEPLMIHNSVTGELTPWLATAYEWNQDYTELSFTIRRGVKFSDGTPLTSPEMSSLALCICNDIPPLIYLGCGALYRALKRAPIIR